jgi:hypothetical protein
MFTTYKINNKTKYWQTSSSARRVAKQLNAENETQTWVCAWENNKGWFLEDLNTEFELTETQMSDLIEAIHN